MYTVINTQFITNTIDGVVFRGDYWECEEFIEDYTSQYPEFEHEDFIISHD